MAAIPFLDTKAAIAGLVDNISSQQNPSLYIDAEGINLSRFGTISIIQILVHPTNEIFLLDIHLLKNVAFITPGNDHPEATLKSILESAEIPKFFWDLRSDVDAIHVHYEVQFQNVQDIQVMEVATRPGDKSTLLGLTTCIIDDLDLSQEEQDAIKLAKGRGQALSNPQFGGRWQVFDERPLLPELTEYCVGDVRYMPLLHQHYLSLLNTIDPIWHGKVRTATAERLQISQSERVITDRDCKKYGPWDFRRFPNGYVLGGPYKRPLKEIWDYGYNLADWKILEPARFGERGFFRPYKGEKVGEEYRMHEW